MLHFYRKIAKISFTIKWIFVFINFIISKWMKNGRHLLGSHFFAHVMCHGLSGHVGFSWPMRVVDTVYTSRLSPLSAISSVLNLVWYAWFLLAVFASLPLVDVVRVVRRFPVCSIFVMSCSVRCRPSCWSWWSYRCTRIL